MHIIPLYHFTLKSPLPSSRSPNLVVSSHLFLFSLLDYLWRKNNRTSYNQPSIPPKVRWEFLKQQERKKKSKQKKLTVAMSVTYSTLRYKTWKEENKIGKMEEFWENTYTIATVSELICFSEENCVDFSGQTVQWLRALAALSEDLCLIPASLWWLRTLIISFCSEQIWDPLLACTYTAGKKKCSHTSK